MSAFVWAGALLAVTAIVTLAALKGWRGWLDLRRYEIAAAREELRDAHDTSPGLRIEMANLKERLRKLEAIATGVDL
jgi:hypothetical protein